MAATRSSASGTSSPASAPANSLVAPRGEDERQRRGAVAEVDPLHLARRVEVAAAIEDVVGDLEGDPEREAEGAEARAVAPASQEARCLEELSRLQRAAREIVLDGSFRPESLAPLQRFTAGERERRVGEDQDRVRILRRSELCEGAREEVVAGGPRDRLPMLGPRPSGGRGEGRRRRAGRRGRASPCARARQRFRPPPRARLRGSPARSRGRRAGAAGACRRRRACPPPRRRGAPDRRRRRLAGAARAGRGSGRGREPA